MGDYLERNTHKMTNDSFKVIQNKLRKKSNSWIEHLKSECIFRLDG